MAVVATLTKGDNLEYLWKQVDRGAVKDAASYYIQASESGGEPPGRWRGPGAKALGFEPGQQVDREPYGDGYGLVCGLDGDHADGLSGRVRADDAVRSRRCRVLEPSYYRC